MGTNVFTPVNFLNENLTSTYTINNMIPLEESYFLEALGFVNECKRDLNGDRKILYKTIVESTGNEQVIQEGFDRFFEKAKEIIDKIIKYVKALFNKFITALNSLIKRDEHIKKHKNDFDKFVEKNEFDFDGYNFTFYDNVPHINALQAFDSEFEGISASDFDNKEKDALDKIVGDKYDALINQLDTFYDNFRGSVINVTPNAYTPINSSEFPNELFAIYRNGYSDTERITVTKDWVHAAYNRFTNYKTYQNSTKKTMDKIERDYTDIKKKFDKVVSRKQDKDPKKLAVDLNLPASDAITDITITNAALDKLDRYFKAKVDQVEEMGNIHTTAFAAKLDAIKACYKQDKAVLYKALSKIQGTIKEDMDMTTMSDYVFDDKVNQYKFERLTAQADIEHYVNECLILTENRKNKVERIQSLNEAVVEKIKAGFSKVVAFVKKIWAKFMENMTGFLANDKTYLEKYKDIITKRRPIDATYTMRDYPKGIQEIVNTPVPLLNYAQLKDSLTDEITFQKSIVGNKSFKYEPTKQEWTDYCKDLFRGGPDTKEVNATSLNMTDLYNYCYEYKKTVDVIKKDLSSIETSVKNAERVIDSIPKPEEKKPEETQTTQEKPAENNTNNETNNNTETKQESFRFWNDKVVYSHVLEAVLTEDGIKREVNKDSETNKESNKRSGGTVSTNTSVSQNINNISKGDEGSTDDTKEAAKDDVEDAKKRIDVYLKTSQGLFAAKLTAAEEIYKNYMQIIKTHVKDFVGDGKGTNKVASSGTDYNKLSDGQKEALKAVDINNQNDADNATEKSVNDTIESKGITNKGMLRTIADALGIKIGNNNAQ